MIKKNDVWPTQYFQTPNIDEPIEKIWDTIDGYTFESMYELEDRLEEINFIVVLPPLKYKNKVVKGMFFSQAVDAIVEKYPRIKEIFHPIANSMFAGYPGSQYADAYFVCYDNKERETHYKFKHPEKQGVAMLPLQDADFLNEYFMAPAFNTPKTLDVFCVTTAYPVKNMPVFAQSLIAYEKKYGKILKVKYAIGNRQAKRLEDGTFDYSGVRWDAKAELDKVKEILGGDIKKYIDFYDYIDYKDLPKEYSSAKCCVLSTLLEGKNRFISEAMSCDTPVIVFKDFNKYARGDYPIFFENSGEYIPEFTPEAMADTIHKVINNPNDYEPRKNYLKYSGRTNFLNTCIDMIPYYKYALPEYQKGKIMENIWVDLAMQSNYQLSTYDFLYGRNTAIQHFKGMKAIDGILKFYFSRFNIKD